MRSAGAALLAGVCLLVMAGPVCAQAAQLEEKTITVRGVPLTIRRDPRHPVQGQYLLGLNNVEHVMESKRPFSAMLLAVDGHGAIDVVRTIRSDQGKIWVIDFKALPDGLWTFALNRPRDPVWVYDLRLIDPRTREEIVPPATLPSREPDLDGHETVIYDGDRRLFLFYRGRIEGGQKYIDMEVVALSARTGQVVGKWSSKGLFPPTMVGDYLHFNSLSPMPDGRVLASSRQTDTLFVLNLATGRIDDRISPATWKVLDDPKQGFSRQHFAHLRPNGNLVLYDNRDKSEPQPRSRAVEYAVDWSARTLRLVWQHEVEASMPFRFGWGSVSITDSDDVVIGWGDYPRQKGYCDGRTDSVPVFSHVTRQHETVFELRAPCGWHTYRAYLAPNALVTGSAH